MAMFPVRAKKNLGQHFLKDKEIARRVASTLDDITELPVLEVGPGTGMLTQFLLEKGKDLTVVEIDRESVAYLREHFPAGGKNSKEDFLRMDFTRISKGILRNGQLPLSYLLPDILQGARQ